MIVNFLGHNFPNLGQIRIAMLFNKACFLLSGCTTIWQGLASVASATPGKIHKPKHH